MQASARIDTLSSENEELKCNVDMQNQQIEDLLRALQKLEDEKETSEEHSRTTIGGLKSQLADNLFTIQEHRARIEDLTRVADGFRENKDALEKEVLRMVDDARKNDRRAEEQRKGLEAVIREEQEINRLLCNTLKTMEERNDEQDEEISELRSEIAGLEDKLSKNGEENSFCLQLQTDSVLTVTDFSPSTHRNQSQVRFGAS